MTVRSSKSLRRWFSTTERDTSIPGNPYVRLASIRGQHSDGTTELLLSLDYDASGNVWKANYQDAHYREYVYNENTPSEMPHSLTGVMDENGDRYTTISYDDHGRGATSFNGSSANIVGVTYADDDQSGLAVRADTESAYYSFQTPTEDQTFRKPSALIVTPTSGTLASGYTESWVYNYQDSTHCGNLTDERICRYVDRHGVETDYTYDALFERSRSEGWTSTEARRTETDYDTAVYRVSEQRTYDKTNTLKERTAYKYDHTTGAILAKCQIDPAVTYTCSDTGTPPGGVRRWVYSYCAGASGTQYGCPGAGWLQQTTDPRGQTESYQYFLTSQSGFCADDPSLGQCFRRGDLYSVTNALGQTTAYTTYNHAGKLTYFKPPSPNIGLTTLGYDARQRLTSRKIKDYGPGGTVIYPTTTYSYDYVGNLSSVEDPDLVTVTYVRDDAHRLRDVVDNAGNYIHYTLDVMGHRVQEDTYDPTDTLKRTLSRTFDDLNRLESVVGASPTNVTTYGYDGQDRVSTITDARGFATQQSYDGLSRVKSYTENYVSGGVVSPVQNVKTSYVYDVRDVTTSVVDPDSISTTYSYDGLKNLTSVVSHDTGTTLFPSYDPAGNVLNKRDARNVATNNSYDAIGRLTASAYPSNTSLNLTFNYDQSNAITGCNPSSYIDHLTSMVDATGSATYCWNGRDNITLKRQITGARTFTVTYAYTEGQRLQTVVYPSGALVTYSRDTTGQINGATFKANASAPAQTLLSSVTYYPMGPVRQLVYGDGHTLSRTYDQNYWVSSIASSLGSGLQLSYQEDESGNITSVQGGGIMDTATYDPLNRLADLLNKPPGNTTYDSAYTYNGTGDRKTLVTKAGTAQTGSWTYNYVASSHRLNSIVSGGGGFPTPRTYDANGNTTSWPNGPAITYDARNRMATATIAGAVYTFSINGKGERVLATKSINGTIVATTYFVYDESGHLLGEYDSNGTAIQEYVYVDSLLVAVLKGGNRYYVEPDHIGTPRTVIDPSVNQAVWKWTLQGDPFGTTSPNGAQFALNLRFPGQYADTATSTNYNYFRDYEPATGRYAESDPLGLEGGTNTYAYVGSSPILGTDTLGLVHWKGTQTTIGVSLGGGAQRFHFKLTSDCVNNKRGQADVVAGGPAVGGDISFGGTYQMAVDFDDDLSTVDPYVFDGPAKFVGASWALAFMGYSWQAIELGDARSVGGGYQFGWDLSITGGAGISTVTHGKIESCGCK